MNFKNLKPFVIESTCILLLFCIVICLVIFGAKDVHTGILFLIIFGSIFFTASVLYMYGRIFLSCITGFADLVFQKTKEDIYVHLDTDNSRKIIFSDDKGKFGMETFYSFRMKKGNRTYTFVSPEYIEFERYQPYKVKSGKYSNILLSSENHTFKTVFEQSPDIEVLFKFNHTRKTPAGDGYRPTHLIVDNQWAIGLHRYYEVDSVPPGGSAKGTVTFLSPEAYPHSLWVGKKIDIYEGARIVGYATVIKIYNPLLQSNC